MYTFAHLRTTSALITLALLSGATTSSAAFAEEEVMTLEEIVVTSQYREQSLKDVPISVAAIGGMDMRERSIEKMADLQFAVPNFTMAESGIGTNVFIRGAGSGNNQGFEQSVGIYVDGIHHGRAQQSRQPFMDMERVEVLRGPQSILFGKNSVAGALNIVTAKPTQEFEGSVRAGYEPTDNEKEFTGYVSGPISDKVRVRLAGRYHDLDGYMENQTLNRDEPQEEDWALRGTMVADLSDNLEMTFKLEHSRFDTLGRNIEIANELPSVIPSFGGLTYSQILVGVFGADASVLNNIRDDKRHSNGDFSNNKSTEAVMTLNYRMGEHTLTSITGYSNFNYDQNCDCDFTGADVFDLPMTEKYKQFSQEIRLVSPGGEKIDYILGAYFQTSDHDFTDQLRVTKDSVLINALNANPAFAPFGPIFAVNGLAGAGDLFKNTAVPRAAHVDADVYSGFAQLSYHMSDRLTLQLGGRLTHEKKSGTREMTVTNIDGTPLTGAQASLAPDFFALAFELGASNARGAELGAEVLPLLTSVYTGLYGPVIGPATAAQVAGAFGAKIAALGQHPVAGERSETKFSPDIKLQFDATDDAMLYASFSKGSKSGGFDFRANNKGASATMEDSFEFEDETATNYEIGGKVKLAGGAAELNFAGFYTQYKDLQVSIFDGTLGFNVGNAAKADIKGIEVDGRWQVAEGLVLSGSAAYNDFEFKDYPLGRCNFLQTPDSVVNGQDFCDYSGETNQLVSEWQGTLGLDHNMYITDDLELRTNINMFYTSEYHASASLDPVLVQKGYAKINARVALANIAGGWEIAVLGQNLTDKRVLLFGGDAPLSGSSFGAKSTYNFIGRGRTFTLQAMMNF
ncbi:TonB-dependent receptor [Paremcibacter congregatus]|uniref:TonB-dependent receptor n=1 Tax=Paremcibacter congregatus TaxID=2043170 RepID=UPI0030EC3431